MTTQPRIPMVGDATTCPHCGGELTHSGDWTRRPLCVRCMVCRCRWNLSGRLQRYGAGCSSRKR
jgi:hypothetical protein